jgi:hypothetical protein
MTTRRTATSVDDVPDHVYDPRVDEPQRPTREVSGEEIVRRLRTIRRMAAGVTQEVTALLIDLGAEDVPNVFRTPDTFDGTPGAIASLLGAQRVDDANATFDDDVNDRRDSSVRPRTGGNKRGNKG